MQAPWVRSGRLGLLGSAALALVATAALADAPGRSTQVSYARGGGDQNGYSRASIGLNYRFIRCANEIHLAYSLDNKSVKVGDTYSYNGKEVMAAAPAPTPPTIALSGRVTEGGSTTTLATVSDGLAAPALGFGCFSGQTKRVGPVPAGSPADVDAYLSSLIFTPSDMPQLLRNGAVENAQAAAERAERQQLAAEKEKAEQETAKRVEQARVQAAKAQSAKVAKALAAANQAKSEKARSDEAQNSSAALAGASDGISKLSTVARDDGTPGALAARSADPASDTSSNNVAVSKVGNAGPSLADDARRLGNADMGPMFFSCYWWIAATPIYQIDAGEYYALKMRLENDVAEQQAQKDVLLSYTSSHDDLVARWMTYAFAQKLIKHDPVSFPPLRPLAGCKVTHTPSASKIARENHKSRVVQSGRNQTEFAWQLPEGTRYRLTFEEYGR